MAPEDAFEARVCSLSSDGSSVLLWSFYAHRLEGVCFEIDCTGLKPSPQEVKYPLEIPKFVEANFIPTVLCALSHKREECRFEQEYRLIGSDEFVSIEGRLRRIILGPRCNETIATAIRKLAPQGCEVHKAKLDRQRRAVVSKRTRGAAARHQVRDCVASVLPGLREQGHHPLKPGLEAHFDGKTISLDPPSVTRISLLATLGVRKLAYSQFDHGLLNEHPWKE
jgi:hypothetical protein